MTVYLVAGLAFAVAWMLLLGAGRMWGEAPGILRCVAGALVGAVHTAACLMPGFQFLGSLFWRTVFAMLAGWTAYGWKGGMILRFSLLMMGTSFLAEAVYADHMAAAALAGTGLWLLCATASEGGCIPLELCWEGKTLHITALRDTGNTLRDPVTGEQVLVLSPEASCTLTGLTVQQLRSPLDTLKEHPIPGLRLIPYRAVGSSGFLLGLRFPDARVDGKRRNVVAAFAPEGPGRGDGYQALAGGFL